jgi:hypothetical protein
MAKVVDCCIWCHRQCNRPDGFDENKHFLVCSQACMKQEQAFRIMFSDKHIGEKNMRDFGINPNDRGKK